VPIPAPKLVSFAINPKMILPHRLSIYSSLFVSLILIDQFSKYFIRQRGGFYICNHALAFNLSPYWTLVVVVIFALAMFIIKIQETRNEKQTNSKYKFSLTKYFENLKIDNWHLFGDLYLVPWSLITSGAISNIIDRLYFGCVTDFIDLRFWPVFNLADIYITIGSTGLLFILLRKND
jgi:lipoprotein signal peptidase